MFKNMIAPVQAWLLSQGKCVGCSISLALGKKKELGENEIEVTCKKCGRIFIFNKNTKRYRRAPLKDK